MVSNFCTFHAASRFILSTRMCLILRHLPGNLQDTAGHERYESMTRMYYRSTAAIHTS